MIEFTRLANEQEDSETGLTKFQEAFDSIFNEMECDDCDFIKFE